MAETKQDWWRLRRGNQDDKGVSYDEKERLVGNFKSCFGLMMSSSYQ